MICCSEKPNLLNENRGPARRSPRRTTARLQAIADPCRPSANPAPSTRNTVPGLHGPLCGPTTPSAGRPSASACNWATAWARSRTQDGGELRVAFAVVVERVGYVGQPHVSARTLQPFRQRARLRGDPLRRLARQHQGAHCRVGLTDDRYGGRRLLDHRMRVGATEPETTTRLPAADDPSAAIPVARQPL